MTERYEKLVSALGELGLKANIQTFSERKRIQKLVYFMEEFGVKLGFTFGWYLHGPYSPALTQELYDDSNQTSENTVSTISLPERRDLHRLKDFLQEDIESSDSLELLVSLHYLLSEGHNAGCSDKNIIEVLKQKKPFFSDNEITRCYKKVLQIM
ncbi:hypothetical protein MUP77_06410 [Candidatus Bathyarchaeota archaeon]|nr:hypothetical protein [Candidatus Bathyarchaeota archaeon]